MHEILNKQGFTVLMVSEVETSPNQSLQDCMTTEPGRCMAINTSSVVQLSTASWEELGGEMLQGPVVLGKSLS